MAKIGQVAERLRPSMVSEHLLARFPHMLQLDLTRCSPDAVDDRVLSAVARLTLLTQLSFQGVRSFSSTGLNQIAHLPRLRSLKLRSCHHLSRDSMQALAESLSTDLTELDLTGSVDLRDESFARLTARLPLLETLSLHLCSSLSPSSFCRLSSLRHLHTLNLQNLAGLSDASLSKCGPMPALTLLELGHNANLHMLTHQPPLAPLDACAPTLCAPAAPADAVTSLPPGLDALNSTPLLWPPPDTVGFPAPVPVSAHLLLTPRAAAGVQLLGAPHHRARGGGGRPLLDVCVDAGGDARAFLLPIGDRTSFDSESCDAHCPNGALPLDASLCEGLVMLPPRSLRVLTCRTVPKTVQPSMDCNEVSETGAAAVLAPVGAACVGPSEPLGGQPAAARPWTRVNAGHALCAPEAGEPCPDSGTRELKLRSMVSLAVRWPMLKHLSLTGNTGLQDGALLHLMAVTTLTRLDLDHCESITDAGLAYVLRMPLLKLLSMHSCTRITSAAFSEADSPHMAPLSHLVLANCQLIRNSSLSHMSKLTSLEDLRICGCAGVGDLGLLCVAALTKLTLLDISKCAGVTSALTAHIGALKLLRSLDISATSIRGGSLAPVRALTLLTALNLAGLRDVGDATAQLLQPLQKLQQLNIGRTQMSMAGIELLQTMPELVEINHFDCTHIPWTGCQPIIRSPRNSCSSELKTHEFVPSLAAASNAW